MAKRKYELKIRISVTEKDEIINEFLDTDDGIHNLHNTKYPAAIFNVLMRIRKQLKGERHE